MVGGVELRAQLLDLVRRDDARVDPSRRFTSARSIIVFTDRSEWARVRWPCWEKSMLKFRSWESVSYSPTLAS